MKVISTPLEGLKIIEPSVFTDHRGSFLETFNAKVYETHGITIDFVQDNQSSSVFGTLRGMHFQKDAAAQTKLVWVSSGKVLDVVVDLRKSSKTYKQTFSIELDSGSRKQLLVPRGFAHGFLCLSENAVFSYKCDSYYDKHAESGIRFDDPDLKINWGIEREKLIISERDKILPTLREIEGEL